MKNWNTYTAEERMLEWRHFRLSLKDLDNNEVIERVAEFFKHIPIASRYVDYYTPASWPTPWEILSRGWCCESSISLLMAHTFLLNDMDCDIYLVDSPLGTFLLPVIDGLVLNYEFGNAVELSKQEEIKIKQIHKL